VSEQIKDQNHQQECSSLTRRMIKSDRMKILIVDDESNNISVLSEILKGKYAVVAALNGKTSLELARQEPQPDLILLDIIMPEMDGYQVCTALKADKRTASIPVIFVTAMKDVEDEAKGFTVGAVDYITKPISSSIVRARVATHLALSHQQRNCEERVERQMSELVAGQKEAVYMLAKAGNYNDMGTGLHVWRMAAYSKVLAKAVGWSLLRQNLILMAASLHDTGKVGLPIEILTKSGKYDQDEMDRMRKHTVYGHNILSTATTPLFKMASEIALHHHERWAGGGYPNDLKGEDIPESARIAAVADVFDALTVRRGRKVWSVERALEFIGSNNGHFEPRLVDHFLSIESEIVQIKEKWAHREKDVLL